ncbi:phosphotransferase [uncultured Friedmanniella sp.]|uniref:phosphotransferase n=1 Tax=uncultured Friedmanniella sp. TaxID=335381 RepID=UPI0035CA57BA
MAIAPGAPDDGSTLLTSAAVDDLLRAAVGHAGGELLSWRMDHVDARPGHSTTVTYAAAVQWPTGRRSELLGASARTSGPRGNDDRAVLFGDGERAVAVWLYPNDPDLPGLARAAVADRLAELFTEHDVAGRPLRGRDLRLEVVSYRPRRRAVLRVLLHGGSGAGPRGAPTTYYVKVLRESSFGPALERHQLLSRAGICAPEVLAATRDCVLVLRAVEGRPLAAALFDEAVPCTAEDLVALLDSLPVTAAALAPRPPWAEAVAAYAQTVEAVLPELAPRLRRLCGEITAGLAGTSRDGREATHGDFHEGQLFVAGGRVTGLIDVDTVGPGRRVDDLGCLLAHLSTVQRMSVEQTASLARLVRLWLPVFDRRVDPAELRLRAAAVVVSLATGPYRGQEPAWRAETVAMVGTAESLVASASGRLVRTSEGYSPLSF